MRATLRLGAARSPGDRAGTAAGPGEPRIQRAHRLSDTASDVAPTPRIQRSPIPIHRTDPTPTIRRKIGNDGTPFVNRQVRKLADPGKGKVGTIKSWNYGGGLWAIAGVVGATNVVYSVQFDDEVQSISGGDDGYELIAPSSAKAAPSGPPPVSAPKPPVRDEAADAETTAAVDALIARLGKPLTDLRDTNGLSHRERKDLLKQLADTKKSPEHLPTNDALVKLTASVVAVENSFRDYAAETVRNRQVRDNEIKAAEAKRAQDEIERKAREEVEWANKQRCGKSYGQFSSKVSDARQLALLLGSTPRGEEGQLLECLQREYDPGDLLRLLQRPVRPSIARDLLARIDDRPFEQLNTLLDHIQPGEHSQLSVLLSRTAPDKSTLVALLIHLKDSAKAAVAVMAKAADGAEASVLAMLVGGRSATETTSLLSTVSGGADTAGAATISAGVADLATARTLLDQPGVEGNAKQALDVFAHATVAKNVAVATELLNKQGNASDALALLEHGCSLVQAGQLLATTGIADAGADAVWCLAKNCSVADLVALLSVRTATEIRSYHAVGHGFVFVKNELAITPTQQFWAGETCGAPAFAGSAKSIADIIADARKPVADREYAGGAHFGNHGRLDSQQRPVMFLPPANDYREYDLKPFTTAENRGTRRIVVGGGHMYYTADHYRTFERFA